MPNSSIAAWVADRALSDPHAPAIKQGEMILSYAALDGAASRFATQLADLGVGRGDRVALIMPNVAYFPIAYYAVLRLGAIVVPMNPLLKAGEIAATWSDCGAAVAVVFPLFAEEAQQAAAVTGTRVLVTVPQEFEQRLTATAPTEPLVEMIAEDTAVILYTSGTTGQPKGAELSHANLRSNALTDIETLMPNGPGDMIFGGLPLFHSFGQTCGLNAAMAGGACLTLLPRFDAEEALRIVHEDRVTIFLGVPTMYMGLLGVSEPQRFDTSSVRIGASGGASLPVEVLHGVERTFGFRLLEGYGLSETSPVASFNHPDRPSKPGSVGTPIRGVEFALHRPTEEGGPVGGATAIGTGNGAGVEVGEGEIGEIVIRGENVMKGYWNRPAETAEVMRGGWFHTGDLATRDADGFYFIVDRVKDLIIRNGFNVYPREVEEVLYKHPAVAEAAVFGVPDAEHGEEVAALVTLKAGATATPEELQAFVAERIAAFKYPRIVRLGTLPKGPTGKILKREIVLDR